MSKQDYYEALGISKGASADEIKKAYRRMAMKHHPDRNKNNAAAEKKFKYINEAYSVLSDDQKKAAYDQFGHQGVDGAAAGAGGHGAGGFDFSGDIFGKIFEEFVGGNPFGQQSSGPRQGHDLKYTMSLSLEEAIAGVEKEIQFNVLDTCQSCNGKGAESASDIIQCPTCNGVGQVRMQQGFLSIQQTCPHCKGEGKIIKNPCRTCHGQKRVEKNKKVSVNIPQGVDTGNRIRLSGEGEAGEDGAPSGDLYIEIQVKPHKIFKRQGNDLYCEVPIQFTEAALGAEITIPTINGKVNMKVSPETQTGATYRLRGKGVKGLQRSTPGDLICKINIETPVSLTKDQKKLLSEFASLIAKGGSRHSPKATSWFNHIKKFISNIGS